MWCKTKMAIAALLISGISVALIDVTSAEIRAEGEIRARSEMG